MSEKKLGHVWGEVACASAADRQHAEHLFAVQDGNRQHRAPSVLEQDVQIRVALGLSKVRNLERLVGAGGPTDEGRLAADRDRPQLLEQVVAAAESVNVERVAHLVVFQDRSAVGSQGDVAEAEVGEPHRIADDAFQNLIEVQARADRLVHLLQRLEMSPPCSPARSVGTQVRASG